MLGLNQRWGVAYPREFNATRPGATLGHAVGGVGVQQIGLGTAQQQCGRGDGIVQARQQGVAFGSSTGLVGHGGAKRGGNGGVVVQHPALGGGTQHGARQCQPLLGRVGAKAGRDLAQVGRGSLFAGKRGRVAHKVGNALERNRGQLDTHVVEHQPTHAHQGHSRQGHAYQAPHAGTHPIDGQGGWIVPSGAGVGLAQMAQHHRQVGDVGGNLVLHGVVQPVAVATASHIHTHHARVRGQRSGQRVKVPALAREAMHAHHHVVGLLLSSGVPVPPRDTALGAVFGVGAGHVQVLQGGF